MRTYIDTVIRQSADQRRGCLGMISAAILAITLLSSGCAGVSVRRDVVGQGPKGNFESFFHGLLFFAQPKGVRYYQPANFILVTVSPDQKITTEHKILPDLERKLSAQPVAFLSKVGPIGNSGGEIVFKDSMLVSTKFNADATVIPTAIIKTAEQLATEVIKAVGPALPAAMFDTTAGPQTTRVFLFRLRLNGEGVYELVGQDGFRVAVIKPKNS